MATAFKLSVVSPDRTVFDEPVQSVVAPSVMGYLGVMAHHEPAIIALKTGIVELTDLQSNRHYISVSGGFMEVSEEGAIILATTAERSTEIDIEREQAALEAARRALRQEDSSMTEQEATEELQRAMNRIKAAQRR